MGATVEFRFNAEEWAGLTPAERLRRCSLWSEEAIKLASSAPEHLKDAYILIAKGWLKLAAEIERELG